MASENADKPLVESEELYPPIVFHGTIFKIWKSGIKISQKPSCFHRYEGEYSCAWDSLLTADLQFGCFSGTLTLKREAGLTPIVIHGSTSKLREAAQIIYKEMNNNSSKGSVDDEVVKKLGKQAKKITILENGLVLNKKTGLCSGRACFVPWGSVVATDMNRGCCYSSVTVSTMVNSKDIFSEGIPESTKGVPMAATKTNVAADDDEGEQFASATLSGSNAVMEPVFDLITKLMCGGQEGVPIEEPKIKRTEISSIGLKTKTSRRQTFLGWNAITSMDYAGALIGSGTVTLTDRVGGTVRVKGVAEEDYVKLREIFVKQTTNDKGGGMPDAIVRKGMRIASEGLSVPTRHCCHYDYTFYKWKDIDAVEMSTGCFGGTLFLITGGGAKDTSADRVPVWKASIFSTGQMVETLQAIRQMKYGNASDETGTTMYFAGKQGDGRCCRLTDASIRLVAKTGMCSAITCVLDLDSITDCWVRREKGCMASTYVCIGVNKAMGAALHVDNHLREAALKDVDEEHNGLGPEDQTLLIKLKRNEKDRAGEIKRAILDRADKRKKDEAEVKN